RAFRDKIHMRAFAEDLARGANRIAQPLHPADAAAAQRRSLHDERVELHFPVAIEEAAPPGVEGLIVFHAAASFSHGTERSAAFAHRLPSGSDGVTHAVQVRVDHVIGNRPCATVHYEYGIGCHANLTHEKCRDSLALEAVLSSRFSVLSGRKSRRSLNLIRSELSH